MKQGALKFKDWVGLLSVLAAGCGFLYGIYDARFNRIEEIVTEHEIRITKREANAFTSQQASDLSNTITRLSIELVQQQKAMDKGQARSEALAELLDELRYSLRVTPSDVLDEVKKTNEKLESVSSRLTALEKKVEH